MLILDILLIFGVFMTPRSNICIRELGFEVFEPKTRFLEVLELINSLKASRTCSKRENSRNY